MRSALETRRHEHNIKGEISETFHPVLDIVSLHFPSGSYAASSHAEYGRNSKTQLRQTRLPRSLTRRSFSSRYKGSDSDNSKATSAQEDIQSILLREDAVMLNTDPRFTAVSSCQSTNSVHCT